MIVRYPDWNERLRRYLEANRQHAFRWGSFDCCLFACNVVREITGVDLASPYRGQYRTMLGAFRLAGGSIENLVASIAKKHGLERFADKQDARPGDVVLATPRELPSLGVVGFNRLGVFSTTAGLAELPFNVVRDAWRIG